ncbi:MAG: TonB-dependent receptor [Steroidobacteraceae bacterium]
MRILRGVTTTLTASLAAAPLLAQNTTETTRSGTTIEEVVVTAQRRAESVQDVPIAVSAFTEAEMERRQITETLDLVKVVPNLVGHNNTGPGNSNAYFIRGLGNTESIPTFDPPVGTYIDDIYIGRQSANNFALVDVERIEVLRGPQGTLFGRNTTGGAINVITKKPDNQFAAFLEAGVGRFDRREVRGSVDVPVSDTVLTKLSGFYQEADGFVTSTVTGEKNNNLEGYGGRLAVRLLPTDTLTWDLAADYGVNSQVNLARVCNPAPGGTTPDANCAFGADADNNRTGFSNKGATSDLLADARAGRGMRSETETMFFVSNIAWKVGDVDLQFITGYRDESWEYVIDFVPIGVRGLSGFAISNDLQTDQITQEIKATGTLASERLRYTTGIFYINENNETDWQDISGPTHLIDRIMDNGTKSIAAYLQLDFNLTDALSLTAGGRYTDEKKDIAYTSRNDRGALFNISTAELVAGGVPIEQEVGTFTPHFGLQYKMTPDLLWYASATNGFKSGGWNARGGGTHTAASYQPFGPEEVWSYEAGFKSELADNSIRLNVNAFWADVENLQLVTGIPSSTGVVFLTANSGEARFRGAEIEWQWLPTENLNLYGSIGLMDGEYTSIKPQPVAQITTGTVPTRTPNATGNLGFVYTIPSTLGPFTIAASTSYTDAYYASSNNLPAFSLTDARWLFDAQIGWTSSNESVYVNGGCKNCGGKDYLASWFLGPYMGDPMTWEVKAGYRFK